MLRQPSVLLLIALGVALSVAGCATVNGVPLEPRVVSVSIDQDEMALEVGEQVTLTASVEVVGGVSDAVLWGSSDTGVASVDGDGVVTAVGAGEAQITATSVADSAVSDSITVEVTEDLGFVLSVSIDQDDMALEVGEQVTLTASVDVVGDVNDAVLWGSSDTGVASVDANGVVTAVGAGEAQITATSVADSAVSDSITVEVTEETAVDFAIDAQGETVTPDVLETITVPPNSIVLLSVDYPTVAADLMYLEIEPVGPESGLMLELWDATADERLLVSRSPALFATSPGALGPTTEAGTALARSSISVAWTCFGPCTAQPYRSGTSYARIVNESAAVRTVNVYAYGFMATDENEPNDTPAAATEFVATALGDAVTGAIEHVDDHDYFRIECDDDFPFESYILELISDFEGDMVLTAGGEEFSSGVATGILSCGSVVHVRTLDGTAGPSAESSYSITVN